MFENFRKKISAALPDIENLYPSTIDTTRISTSNAAQIFYKVPTSTNSENIEKTKIQKTAAVNLNAGCKLIKRKEEIWKDLHAASEENVKRLQICDASVLKISDSIKKNSSSLSDIIVSIEIVPNIVQTAEKCSLMLADIREKCYEVEHSLINFNDLMENLHLQQKQLDSKFEIAMLKENKLANLDKIRQSLASRHAETVQQNDVQRRLMRQERQKVFEEAFQSDMNYYKEVGKLPKIQMAPKSSLSLEEIIPDENTDELNNFLEST